METSRKMEGILLLANWFNKNPNMEDYDGPKSVQDEDENDDRPGPKKPPVNEKKEESPDNKAA